MFWIFAILALCYGDYGWFLLFSVFALFFHGRNDD